MSRVQNNLLSSVASSLSCFNFVFQTIKYANYCQLEFSEIKNKEMSPQGCLPANQKLKTTSRENLVLVEWSHLTADGLNCPISIWEEY